MTPEPGVSKVIDLSRPPLSRTVLIPMADDIEIRRRRAAWRAQHRGTKELDILIGAFAMARLADMDGAALSSFERFLEVSDPELQAWLLGPGLEPNGGPRGETGELVRQVRVFHGLE